MRTLVIDTATEALSVALCDDDRCIAAFHEIVGRGHAEQLMPRVAALPEGGRAERILVDTGPGSFTGVRVGLAAARALGYAWNVPVVGYSALALVALAARRTHNSAEPITVVMTGGHGELFWQQFAVQDLAPLAPPVSTPISVLAGQLDSPLVYGSGATALVAAGYKGRAVPLHPEAADAVALPPALFQEEAGAVYGRGADAMTVAQRQTLAVVGQRDE
ncbi:tRNA (adenosine(37)-N6)-threonylcarbamoyltransferase complex dimerization subunit type 1 TsaB [Sphingobium subterraneum]|uniref:tRNA threonylcarbamoyl adenosine modification protein YeaZ n=1 Tax=Sphingobium subterraneum TaxID=627688 RepID=A0A841IX49_9SPHN|nr:tRNA (adenosine(37)-N6)-threonylcarbamoyltransferase complex dimerization subunit type 1 TsaB [Sphingobium subterraneum]MBB6123207.1 tRNA threonylcarbamoyl adenosine modification protein YeaZ [Sphingobium subterraneum]